MGRKTPEPVKQPKPKKTPDDKRLISFRIAHAVADPSQVRGLVAPGQGQSGDNGTDVVAHVDAGR